MDVIAALFGILIVLGVPIVGLVSGLVSWSRINGLTRRIEDLEAEQLRLHAELQRTQHSLAGWKAARPAGAQAIPQGAAPLTGPAGAIRDGSAPLTGPAGAIPQGSAPLPDAAAPGRAGRPPRIGPARPPLPGMGRPADGPPPVRRPAITVEWLITRLAAALGGFSLLLGAIFALSAAIDKGWVGPGLRVFVGLLLGTGAVVRGATLRAKGMSWSGAGLLGAGESSPMCFLYMSTSCSLVTRFTTEVMAPPILFSLTKSSPAFSCRYWMSIFFETSSHAACAAVQGAAIGLPRSA
jgi:hypothetical protein